MNEQLQRAYSKVLKHGDISEGTYYYDNLLQLYEDMAAHLVTPVENVSFQDLNSILIKESGFCVSPDLDTFLGLSSLDWSFYTNPLMDERTWVMLGFRTGSHSQNFYTAAASFYVENHRTEFEHRIETTDIHFAGGSLDSNGLPRPVTVTYRPNGELHRLSIGLLNEEFTGNGYELDTYPIPPKEEHYYVFGGKFTPGIIMNWMAVHEEQYTQAVRAYSSSPISPVIVPRARHCKDAKIYIEKDSVPNHDTFHYEPLINPELKTWQMSFPSRL